MPAFVARVLDPPSLEPRRNLVRFVGLVALVFLCVYGSDLFLTTRPDLCLGLSASAAQASTPLWRPWAYVPVDDPDQAALPNDVGQPVMQEHAGSFDLTKNDLYRRVLDTRKRLRIGADGVTAWEVPFAPLRALAPWLGGQMQWPGCGKALVFTSDGAVSFVPGEKRAQRNFRDLALPYAPFVSGHELYVPLESLAKVYGMKLTREPASGVYVLSAGDRQVRVLMPQQAFHIEICRSGRWLKVFYAGALAKHYGACTGQDENTPVGEFRIQNKCEWPGWKAYWGEYIPSGSPRNPLGARFLGTTARGHKTGWVIGIHGTNQPSSIGQRISGGCVRLLNEHAIELYEVIPIGTGVTIHE